MSAITKHLGAETDVDHEVAELARDVAPETILAKIEEIDPTGLVSRNALQGFAVCAGCVPCWSPPVEVLAVGSLSTCGFWSTGWLFIVSVLDELGSLLSQPASNPAAKSVKNIVFMMSSILRPSASKPRDWSNVPDQGGRRWPSTNGLLM